MLIEDPKLIEEPILAFYINLYADFNPNDHTDGNMSDFIGTYVPSMVSSVENNMLTKCRDDLEIKNVVFYLNGNSAPSYNGFGGVFYHSCLDIIRTDFLKMFSNFLNKIGFFLG